MESNITFEGFFKNTSITPNAYLIKGVFCGFS
ncbi:hypothetical protein [Polaribacter sp.]